MLSIPKTLAIVHYFTLGLAGDQASSVPITFTIPNSQIKEDFGFLEPTSYDLYKKYAERFDESALGFQEYHPYKGDIAADRSCNYPTATARSWL